MSRKVKTIKEFLKEKEKSDKLLLYWEESGLLSGLDKEDARTLVKLLEELALIYMGRPIASDKAATFAFPIARRCFSELDYLIKNAHKFVKYLDGRVAQEEIVWDKMNVSRMEEMNTEAEFCNTVANEVKAMQL